MYVIFLKFSENKSQAGQYMEAHKAWLQQGFEEGVFVLAGSLQSNMGGGIFAHNVTLDDLQSRVNDDPFVVENVVTMEIMEIAPSRTDSRLDFLMQ